MQDLTLLFSSVEDRLGYHFKDKKLLVQAFTHRSFFNESRRFVKEHNERLEFLGDAVLGLLISDYLYQRFPSEAEGKLSWLKARLVEARSCAKFLLQLELAPFVLLGKGERANEGKGRETILSDLFEALIGAIYLDGGMEEVRKIFLFHFEEKIQDSVKNPTRNWKAELQEYSQKRYQKSPVYKVMEETGPGHSPNFLIAAYLNDKEAGRGRGSSKKEAEQIAAEDSFLKGFCEQS